MANLAAPAPLTAPGTRTTAVSHAALRFGSGNPAAGTRRAHGTRADTGKPLTRRTTVDQAAAEDDGAGTIQLGQIRARVGVVDDRIGRSAGGQAAQAQVGAGGPGAGGERVVPAQARRCQCTY